MKKILCLIMSGLVLTSLLSGTAYAADAVVDYYINNDGDKVAIPDTYVPGAMITGGESTGKGFNSAQDLYVDDQNCIYVADTGNNRIVKMTKEGKNILEITAADGVNLISPQGVFVDDYHHIFVADTGNGRIVHFSKDGKFIESFVKPDSTTLAEMETFSPTKLIYNKNTGFLYSILGKQLLTIDSRNEFKGYFASNKVGFSLKNFLIRKFATSEQKKALGQDEAVAFYNVCYKHDKIYATTYGTSDNIRIINNIGTDLFSEGSFGEIEIDENGLREEPVLIDITTNEYDIITVAQQNNGKIYQYDNEGNLLLVFGGKGATAGYFNLITAIDTDSDGNLYILDSASQTIQIMEPTHFTQLIHQANSMYNAGEYDEALMLLQEIKSLSPSYKTAGQKIGNIFYKQKKYKDAMTEFKIAGDQVSYAKAFEKQRYSFMQEHFLLIIAFAAVAVFLLLFLLRKASRASKKIEHKLYFEEDAGWRVGIMLIPLAIFHPVSCYDRIKHNRKNLSVFWGIGLLVILCVLRIIQIVCTNYTVADTTSKQANFPIEMITCFGIVLFFAIVNYLVTALQYGETTLKESILNCTYSLVPILVFLPLFTSVSWVIGATETAFYTMGMGFIVAWSIVITFVSVGVANNYTVKKTIKILLLTFFAMAIVAALVILFATLAVHAITSLNEMYTELNQLGV